MDFLYQGILSITPQQLVMYEIGFLLIYLAIKKDFEPALLLPMGFGAILVNLPITGVINQNINGIGQVTGIIEWLFHIGIESSEALPLLLFIGIGAMIDFGPLLSNPKMLLFGAAAQFGIFFALSLSTLMGFDLKDAAFKICRCNCCSRLFLHGTCSDCATICHQTCYNKKRTPHSHEIQSETSE